jgi:hypothetical protein
MDTKLIADIDALRRTAERLERAGLIVDRACLSPELRRAFFAMQCAVGDGTYQTDEKREPIGFKYPNAR